VFSSAVLIVLGEQIKLAGLIVGPLVPADGVRTELTIGEQQPEVFLLAEVEKPMFAYVSGARRKARTSRSIPGQLGAYTLYPRSV
jgi:hypothetical protein